MDTIIAVLRYVAPVAAVFILATCVISLFRNRPRVHRLARLIDQNDGTIIEITHWETSIGKSKANDIVLPLPTVARFHAVIAKKRRDWVVTDTSARAIGILVNGENKASFKYESEDFTKLFDDGKAYFVISASCDGTTAGAFKYTITDVSFSK